MTFLTKEEIRKKEDAKRARNKRREGYADLKSALPLANQIETIVPNVRERMSKSMGVMQEFISKPSPEWNARVNEVWIRDGQKCRMCAKPLYERNWDPHHIVQKSLGGDDSLANLMAVCKYPGDPRVGLISCHELLHRTDLIEKKFAHDPDERERYLRIASGEAFQREASE